MKFWLFRSNLRILEYYHSFNTIDQYIYNCHDYYILMLLYFLRKNYFEEVVVWRLCPPDREQFEITLEINGKLFIQRWVKEFSEVFKYESPNISFFRGGFKEYDELTIQNKKFFGLTLYLGAGVRVVPMYGGIYDIILLEDERDIKQYQNRYKVLPFYKTANSNIFKPLDLKKDYDICWPCNFEQLKHKGQAFFLNLVGSCPFLRNMKIVHCGNQPELAKKMAADCNVTNIEFKGHVSREELNIFLNRSKIAINTSNLNDGCPRISTEILMSGTPLLIRETVRLLDYYKKYTVVSSDGLLIKKIQSAVMNYQSLAATIKKGINTDLSLETITEKNILLWEGYI